MIVRYYDRMIERKEEACEGNSIGEMNYEFMMQKAKGLELRESHT